MILSIGKKLIEKSLDKLLKFKSFQDYVNFRYNREGFQPVKITRDAYYYRNGFFFSICDQLYSIDQVINEYLIEDISSNDIVLDIGANIGAFSLFAAKKAKQVYAVEPLYSDILKKNLEMNAIKNVKILEIGLGRSALIDLSYCGRKKTVQCMPLSKIIDLCGEHVDFLKIDCEGSEWTIAPEELKGIRRIECEVHNFNKNKKFYNFLKILAAAGYSYSVNYLSKESMLVHAKHKSELK